MCIGKVIKSTPYTVNHWIPAILMVIGGVVYPLLINPAKLNWESECHPVVLATIQGIAFGGVATALHQGFKQFLGRDDTKSAK